MVSHLCHTTFIYTCAYVIHCRALIHIFPLPINENNHLLTLFLTLVFFHILLTNTMSKCALIPRERSDEHFLLFFLFIIFFSFFYRFVTELETSSFGLQRLQIYIDLDHVPVVPWETKLILVASLMVDRTHPWFPQLFRLPFCDTDCLCPHQREMKLWLFNWGKITFFSRLMRTLSLSCHSNHDLHVNKFHHRHPDRVVPSSRAYACNPFNLFPVWTTPGINWIQYAVSKAIWSSLKW